MGGPRRGVSLIELMISIGVLVLGLLGIVSVIAQTTRLNAVDRETLAARRSAERMIESMISFHWKDLFKHYTANANDAYTNAANVSAVAHGPDFEVEKNDAGLQVLAPRPGDPDGKCGKILFPSVGTELRELGSGAFLETGQDLDLNGNGVIDGGDVSSRYALLPVKIVIEWQGVHGPRSLTFHHLFMER